MPDANFSTSRSCLELRVIWHYGVCLMAIYSMDLHLNEGVSLQVRVFLLKKSSVYYLTGQALEKQSKKHPIKLDVIVGHKE